MKRKAIAIAWLLAGVCSLLPAQEKERGQAFDNYRRYQEEALRHPADAGKKEAIARFRRLFAQKPYRYHSLSVKEPGSKCLEDLGADGIFQSLRAREEAYVREGAFQKPYSNPQQEIGLFLTDAFNRIWRIADDCRTGKLAASDALSDKVLQAILHYGSIETGRPNDGPRFHASCFAIPTAAVNTYFCFLEQMEQAEAGKGSTRLQKAADMLKAVALQAWTQPFRHDATDADVVSIDRFRNHVWWVGGNALAYRSLLPVAAMYRSVPMVDLLAEVYRRGISMTSQNTYSEAFWTEGFTADGAGWGHGKQCLIWGYPIDGTANALSMLQLMKGTPWAARLDRDNAEALLNFLRGGAWYYYKGYRLPCLDRGSYVYNPGEKPVPYAKMLDNLVDNWLGSFTPGEQKELKDLQREVRANRVDMEGYDGYQGTRWFFNNDDLIKKNPRYHITVNMASVRCDGLESAPSMADAYNFFDADGLTLFQRDGDEYFRVMGAWDVTASPGVTAREGMDALVPVENWRGYCSSHNFAAAATLGDDDAVAGYIFEKMDASLKEGVNDRGDGQGKNPQLYGFKAYKSYFMLGDYTVMLGAGITAREGGESFGPLRTTIDQTARVGEVYLWKDGRKEALTGEAPRSLLPGGKDGRPLWLVQEGKFAYAVLPAYTKTAYAVCEMRPTDWVKRNPANAKVKDLPAQADILRLWADHGVCPKNDTYGYVVYAGEGLPSEKLPFEVLRNDTLVQAVRSADGGLLEAVFYPGNDGLATGTLALTVSAPCTVLLKRVDGGYLCAVADACMDKGLEEITLTLDGRSYAVPMPQGMLGGKPAVIRLDGI